MPGPPDYSSAAEMQGLQAAQTPPSSGTTDLNDAIFQQTEKEREGAYQKWVASHNPYNIPNLNSEPFKTITTKEDAAFTDAYGHPPGNTSVHQVHPVGSGNGPAYQPDEGSKADPKTQDPSSTPDISTPDISTENTPAWNGIVETPDVQVFPGNPGLADQLQGLSNLPASAYGTRPGFLGGLARLIADIGIGATNPEATPDYKILMARKEAAQNLINQTVAFKNAAALQQLGQQFQALYTSKLVNPQAKYMALLDLRNKIEAMIPQVKANAAQLPFMIRYLQNSPAGSFWLPLLMGNEQMTPNARLPQQGGSAANLPGAR